MLIGAAAGTLMVLIYLSGLVLPRRARTARPGPARGPDGAVLQGPTLTSLSQVLFRLFVNQFSAVLFAMVFLFVLTLLRMILRRDWLASLVWAALLAAPDRGRGAAIGWVAGGSAALILLLVLRRGGLLSLAVALFYMFSLIEVPITLDFAPGTRRAHCPSSGCWSPWRVYGFHTSLGGKPVFGSSLHGRLSDGLVLSLVLMCLLAAVGFVASVLNIVAAGGSFLTLPVLILLGAPSVEANGTNRLGVIAQNAIGLGLPSPSRPRLAVGPRPPCPRGGRAPRRLAGPRRERPRVPPHPGFAHGPRHAVDAHRPHQKVGPRSNALPGRAIAASLFFTGVYGGFVQAGVGFLVVAVTTPSGIDLVRGAAIKVSRSAWSRSRPVSLPGTDTSTGRPGCPSPRKPGRRGSGGAPRHPQGQPLAAATW